MRTNKWWAREIARINREHAAERAQLIGAIAFLSGKPIPTDTPPPEPEPRLTIARPEQMPDDYDWETE